jgi:predicted PurR-regulated permease PerM
MTNSRRTKFCAKVNLPATNVVNETVQKIKKDAAMAEPTPDTPPPERRFLHRVVLVHAITVLFFLGLAAIWFAADALLLIFACILFAVLLYTLATMVHHRLRIRRVYALALVVALLFGALGAGGWLMAPQIAEQSGTLAAAAPKAIEHVRGTVEKMPLVSGLVGKLPPADKLMAGLGRMTPRAGLFFSGVLGAVGNVFIILFVGIYFAAQPFLYIDALVTLVPPRRRDRAREVLGEIGATLSQWLLGKAASMLIVGVFTSAGLMLLGVPLALILGIIAGLLDFIPYLGPLMAGVPAVLIAFSDSPQLALYTVLLFVAVQTLEGYLLSPLIERRTVSLPPALTIVMQVLFGALFGLAGVALATPLTAVLAVLVAMLYVQDVLKDQVRTPTEL